MPFTINPATGKRLKEYKYQSEQEIKYLIEKSANQFTQWKQTSFNERVELLTALKSLMQNRKESLSKLITLEMGKPITQSRSELDKCCLLIDHYREFGESYLEHQTLLQSPKKSYVRYDPLGVIFAIMPWNYPFWQVFRFMVPAIFAGNTVLLKHAPGAFGSAEAIEELMRDAGFPDGVFGNLIVDVVDVQKVIANEYVKAVTFTGSSKAGRSVASLAGSYLKKTVLELGGSNAFIVMNDADLNDAAKIGALSRLQNTGQSCIAAKRFLIHEEVYDEYLGLLKAEFEKYTVGEPTESSTEIGPIARRDLCDLIERQVQTSIHQGAKMLIGAKREDNYYFPTILELEDMDNVAFQEEIFGPVAACKKFSDIEEAVKISNNSEFGLGVSVFTKSKELIKDLPGKFEDGAVFFNAMVKSDPGMPFGGTKKSGYGRELSREGMLEFVNIKTVVEG